MSRLLPVLAACTALASPALAFDIDAMNAQERGAFGEEVRRYILENPQIIMEAVAILEEQREADQTQNDVSLVAANSPDLFQDTNSWSGGNPDGDISLVEFVDYRCGYCRRAHDEVAALVSSDGNIRLIIKELPILGEASVLSSRFAIATRQLFGDEAYKLAHDALIALNSDVTPAVLSRLANTLGLDSQAILIQMDSQDVTDVINANRRLAQKMAINGTPTFVMETVMLRGYLPLDGLRQMLADVRIDG
jgi:protein-disulfide isomerase